MCREVILEEPYNFKPRSPERGKVWDSIATHLNDLQQPAFRVTARSVRDRYALLTSKRAQKIREEEKASGIDVEDVSELDNLLEDILEREKEGKAAIEAQNLEKNKKSEKEKGAVDLIRRQAMEKMEKRQSDEFQTGTKKKGRRSTSDAIDYLKEKASKEYDLRKEEMELKKKEQDQSSQQQQDMMKVLLNQMQQQQQQQQNLQTMFLSQQQQQNEILKALIENKK